MLPIYSMGMRPSSGTWLLTGRRQKIDSPFCRSPQLSRDPQLEQELVMPSQLHVGIMATVILCKIFVGSHICWEIVQHVQRMLLYSIPPWTLALWTFLPHFLWWSLSLGVREVYTVVWFVTDHSRHVFFPLWVVTSFCVNHYLLYKETSLMRSGYCSELWVQRCQFRR